LVSSGYTDGFYYKPRIDKAAARVAFARADWIDPTQLPEGRSRDRIRTEQARKALEAAATYRDILGRGNFFLEMQYQGIEEQRIVNTGLLPIARDLGCRSCARTTCTICGRPTSIRTTSCCASARARASATRSGSLSRRSVLPEDGEGDGRGLRRLSGGARQHDAHRGALRRHIAEGQRSCRTSRAAGTRSTRTSSGWCGRVRASG
jgi:hypothetical protein